MEATGWPYTLRNANDNIDLTSLPLAAGISETFILRVTMPQTGVASGESETVTVLARSQNNGTVSDQVLVKTSSPYYLNLTILCLDLNIEYIPK
ncbi:hypothetical protein MHK_010047, partial [Candidatus Magnetomorum sp. HK-1]